MRLRAFIAGVLALLVIAAVPAIAATKAEIKTVGKTEYKINRYVKADIAWAKDVYTIKSGSTVTITNVSADEPHTLSIVKPGDLPRTTKAIDGCFEKGICGKIGQAHEFPEDDGPPAKPVVDGGDGFNKVGDSIVINPKGQGPKATFKLTAKKGSTLNFLCAIHPWMQAKIKAN